MWNHCDEFVYRSYPKPQDWSVKNLGVVALWVIAYLVLEAMSRW